MSNSQPTKFYQGTNFWVSIVLFLGGLFAGFPSDLAAETVEYWVAGIAGIFAVREKLKDAKIDWRAWIGNTNTWAYLGTFVTALVPVIPAQLFTDLASLAHARRPAAPASARKPPPLLCSVQVHISALWPAGIITAPVFLCPYPIKSSSTFRYSSFTRRAW